MHTTKDYGNSPAKAFDAVEDIKEYLGKKRWNDVQEDMKAKSVVTFINLCSFAGIEGYPVKAWYDLLHGEGSYDQDFAKAKAEYDAKPKEPGKIHMIFG